MDQETFKDELTRMKKEVRKAFKEQCKSPKRLVDGVRSSFMEMLEKEIDTQMDGWV